MVAFRNIITAALALATPITAAISAAEVTVNIKVVTQKSMALQQPAQSISLVNGPLILIGQGPFPKLIFGFADIVTTATAAIFRCKACPRSLLAQPPMQSSRHSFVRVHQALLNILIGKAGLFQAVPFIGQPIAAVLRQIEGVVDEFLPSFSSSLCNGAAVSFSRSGFLITDIFM
ncbi:hypothetical protein A1F94_013899 [Pyrenophora tritici-repentis]|nr:hypothetical protein A1F94_013899 [Pyrenophora tritici-repentis]